MTKAEIIERVYQELDHKISKKESASLVEEVFDAIKKALEENQKLKISGFGNFVVRHKKERTGRNPKNGDKIKISSRNVLTFKPSQVLKKAINKPITKPTKSAQTTTKTVNVPKVEDSSKKEVKTTSVKTSVIKA